MVRRRIWLVLAVVLGFGVLGTAAHAQLGLHDDQPKVQAHFVAEHTDVVPGATVTVALHEAIRKGWHTYWHYAGDSGAPTTIDWHLPDGWKAGAIQWPTPERLPIGPLMNYGYENAADLLVDLTVPKDAKPGPVTIPADVMWLVCADVCIPESTTLDLKLNVAAAASPPQNQAFFTAARAKMPNPAPWPAVYAADATHFAVMVQSPALAAAAPTKAEFFPGDDGLIENAAPQTLRTVPNGVVVETKPDGRLVKALKTGGPDQVSGVLVLTGADGQKSAFSLAAKQGDIPPAAAIAGAGLGLLQAILFAFVGGLILNLMPCVLPVLSMKALALAKKSGAPVAAKSEALAYGAGAVLTFLALAGVLLALRAGGSAVGWGFQLQQPVFIAALSLLMFAVGLNLSGLFEISAGRFAGVGHKFTAKGGVTGSFLTGLLAVVVATPCTAPFMAAALGFAATQSAAVALAVFFALGIGFAVPFVLLGVSPTLLRALPRPGPWMVTFKQLLAFPMYGAAIWLVWVFSQQTGPDGLFALLGAALALAFGLWAFAISRRSAGAGAVLGLGAAGAALVLVVLLGWRAGDSGAPAQAAVPSGGVLAYQPYSAARLAQLRAAGTPVFVDATASWCITCLVNERVALSRAEVAHAFAAAGVVPLKADWTNQNPEITALLAQYGREGVPLYVYFPPDHGTPRVLPQLLTESIVLSALKAS